MFILISYVHMRASRSDHLILDLTTIMTCGEEFKLRIFPLCNFLNFPVMFVRSELFILIACSLTPSGTQCVLRSDVVQC